MKFSLRFLPILLLLCLQMLGCAKAQAVDYPSLALKEELTIVVTDSGLGGLAVAADIARRVQENSSHKRVNLIFYNALFDAETGYNSLPTREEKVRIFNNALTDMGSRFQPDLIMVACNTLSVLLHDCNYAQQGSVPVMGIVETGVLQMERALNESPDAKVVIFATPTTIDERSHQSGLLAKGVAANRIVQQPCRDLTFYIEQEFDGFDTELMINSFVGEAAGQLGAEPAPIYASFNCTHFGYSRALWKQEIEAAGLELKGMLDPNESMANFLFTPESKGRFPEPEVSAKFVTMVPVSPAAITSISRAIKPVSDVVAESLEKHEVVPGVFAWE